MCVSTCYIIREWRQSVLPCLPHYSGSSVGVREATACLSSVPQPGLLLVTTLQMPHYITERDTEILIAEVMSSLRCSMSDK